MAAPLPIRHDTDLIVLREMAEKVTDRRKRARLRAIANVLDGMDRKTAAALAGMDRQTLRDWIVRFNADGIDGLSDHPRSGRPPFLTPEQRSELARVVLYDSDPVMGQPRKWRIKDLCRFVERRFGVVYQPSGMVQLMRNLRIAVADTPSSAPNTPVAAYPVAKAENTAA